VKGKRKETHHRFHRSKKKATVPYNLISRGGREKKQPLRNLREKRSGQYSGKEKARGGCARRRIHRSFQGTDHPDYFLEKGEKKMPRKSQERRSPQRTIPLGGK